MDKLVVSWPMALVFSVAGLCVTFLVWKGLLPTSALAALATLFVPSPVSFKAPPDPVKP